MVRVTGVLRLARTASSPTTSVSCRDTAAQRSDQGGRSVDSRARSLLRGGSSGTGTRWMQQRMERSESEADERPLWLRKTDHQVEQLRQPGSVSLIVGDRAAGLALLEELGRALGAQPASISQLGLEEAPARNERELRSRLSGYSLLFDLEALFWSAWLPIDPVRYLRQHARKGGVVALWPGRVSGHVATFSDPGRRDHLRTELSGLSLLRPLPTRFPDEVPFEIERIP